MQTNYYFLRQLSKRLSTELSNLVLAECFSQEKDELVLGFCTDGKQWRKRRDFYIKAVLRPDFVCLSFPDEFRRASKNSVDLFTDLVDLHVTEVRQFLNERAFAIVFEQGYTLLFKLFGNRSNVLLFKHNEVQSIFNSKLNADFRLTLQQLDRPLSQTYEAYQQAGFDHKKLYPTFGKEVNEYLEKWGDLSGNTGWNRLQEVVKQLEQPTFYVSNIHLQPSLVLLPLGEVSKTFQDPLVAANDFYYTYSKVTAIDREKGQILRTLHKLIAKTEANIEHQYRKLTSLDDEVKHEEIGHILMANLHEIPERAESIELYDFYRDKLLKIRLKPDYSPQKNAEVYYRKAKNERIEVEKITEVIEQKEQELAQHQRHLKAIESITSLKELRKYLKDNLLESPEKTAPTPELLFRKVMFMGFEIFIGKNAKNNDLLTQRYARKEDLWLHARDVPGSHVVIRRKAGQNFPNPVIEKAAQLAAFYSKRKNDTLCPVIVTPRKYVRKTRDLTEGEVIVEKEEVVLVEPMEE
ncbi:MAG: NFACT RNA binding domain-containing protein [Spirosomataceae bacterium]